MRVLYDVTREGPSYAVRRKGQQQLFGSKTFDVFDDYAAAREKFNQLDGLFLKSPTPGLDELADADMTAVRANGIDIEYAETGPRAAPVILLIMGLGMQLVAWPESFCEGLADRGFRVVSVLTLF